MNDQWESYAGAIESGDSDRVNEVIDEIKDMDLSLVQIDVEVVLGELLVVK